MHKSVERTKTTWVDEGFITLNALFQGSNRLEIMTLQGFKNMTVILI
jgi:hypothetical protein